ncbi:hypothetical protein TNCV_3222311 [Trichonephila clavipes]|nr:hypothetical protein TNCV_3222311 [Trichonephila clavipes]
MYYVLPYVNIERLDRPIDAVDAAPLCPHPQATRVGLGGYTNPFERDNMGTLSESSEFLYVAYSLKSAFSSSGKVLFSSSRCFSFVGFNECGHRR